jgi:hypothetical protein
MKALDLGWGNESWDLMCGILGADVSNVEQKLSDAP